MGHSMPNGEHKNKLVDQLPSDYLKWVSEEWSDEEIRQAAENEYDRRTDESEHWYE